MSTESADLKHLTVLRDRAEHALRLLRQEQAAMDQKMRAGVRELSAIDAKIKKLKENSKKHAQVIIVSEHSILRYLERVKGLDLKTVKEEILPETILQRVRAMGNGEYIVNGPAGIHTIKVQDHTVVTVLTKEERPEQKQKEKPTSLLPVVEAPAPTGQHQCFSCGESVDRLILGACETCTQEDYMVDNP